MSTLFSLWLDVRCTLCVESRGSLGEFIFVLCFIFRCVHSAVTPGEVMLGYIAMEH